MVVNPLHHHYCEIINRVISHFVALFNKLTFCWVFTRVGLKSQAGQGDFTRVASTTDQITELNSSALTPAWRSTPLTVPTLTSLCVRADVRLTQPADFP